MTDRDGGRSVSGGRAPTPTAPERLYVYPYQIDGSDEWYWNADDWRSGVIQQTEYVRADAWPHLFAAWVDGLPDLDVLNAFGILCHPDHAADLAEDRRAALRRLGGHET